MKNTIGQSISLTLFGESHGAAIGAVLDGLAPGVRVDEEYIGKMMDLRRPYGKISTARKEADAVRIVSGVFNGYTTGTPIALIIENGDTNSRDYSSLLSHPRPGHADYTAECKYKGFQDYRGGGHFSGRLTAPIVAAGAIVMAALREKGIKIGTHISRLHGINDRAFSDIESDIDALTERLFPALSPDSEAEMVAVIESAAQAGDSVGGVLETAIIGMPSGVGEPFFDSLESTLSHALFSVPAVKGVEFGAGFGLADMLGSEANDAFALRDGKVITKTNNNGGINGGISNGMPIIIRTAVKPTPSIFKPQLTLDTSLGEERELLIKGRHDPAIIHRARVVIDAAVALAVADALAMRFGTDYLRAESVL